MRKTEKNDAYDSDDDDKDPYASVSYLTPLQLESPTIDDVINP